MGVMQDEFGPPEVGDIVHVAGSPYIVRQIDPAKPEWLLIAGGRTDRGTWIHRDRCRVTYRARWKDNA